MAAAMTAAGTRMDGSPVRMPGPGAIAGAGLAAGQKVGPGSTAPGFAGPGSAGPGFGGPGLAGPGLAGPGSTAAGFAGGMAGAPGTQPIPAGRIRPGDYADVLPPVSYQPPGAGAGRGTGTLSREDWPAGGPAGAARSEGAQGGRDALLVIATMVIAVGISVILPIAGTLGALAALVLLCAGALADRKSIPSEL